MRLLAASLVVSLLASPALAQSPPSPAVAGPSAAPEPVAAPTPAPPPELDPYARGLLEILIPDVRLQTPAKLSDGIDAAVLSWPMHLVGVVADNWPALGGASVFIEPAFPTNHWEYRGLAGVRAFAMYSHATVVAEGGGVLGTDGSGAFVGAGPGFGGANGVFALVGRHYFVSGEDRWDFTLDLTIHTGTVWDIIQSRSAREE